MTVMKKDATQETSNKCPYLWLTVYGFPSMTQVNKVITLWCVGLQSIVMQDINIILISRSFGLL